jgi:hypothetical protein
LIRDPEYGADQYHGSVGQYLTRMYFRVSIQSRAKEFNTSQEPNGRIREEGSDAAASPAAIRTSLGVILGLRRALGPCGGCGNDLSHSRRAGPLRKGLSKRSARPHASLYTALDRHVTTDRRPVARRRSVVPSLVPEHHESTSHCERPSQKYLPKIP